MNFFIFNLFCFGCLSLGWCETIISTLLNILGTVAMHNAPVSRFGKMSAFMSEVHVTGVYWHFPGFTGKFWHILAFP